MAITNYERIGKALELLREGLRPFVERELRAAYGANWVTQVKETLRDRRLGDGKDDALGDVAVLLAIMDVHWNNVFRKTLGRAERSLVFEIQDVRNRWAHQNAFSGDDAERALDSVNRLLTAISAPEADEVGRMKFELRRLIFDEQVRGELRKGAGTLIESAGSGGLRAWREVVTPHRDVASGRYQQAEFAADLWQVHLGEGTDEYRDPVEFFRRTYLTESLKTLLTDATRRLTGQGGDPVVQLQTNFGGGKTHSMLALYHLFSGVSPTELVGIDAVMQAAEAYALPEVRRVVLVGNKISPSTPSLKPDGTVVRTLWGELAWQLGGKEAYARIAADDEHATSPGDALRELFVTYGPSLILIDEWVAYARQLHDQSDLPAGSFETQFSFAQALTESAKLAGNCLLVISLPASDTAEAIQGQADDVEVGGSRGREALERLRNVIGRLESSWRPASAEESFEIVRRRLFEPLADPARFRDRDVVARAFADLYRVQQAEFPPECREADYEKRIKGAYPIHPEIFDRLYSDWSTLVTFQRTRGVLRLMAAVIHSLWEKDDRNPLILPATIPIDDPRVQNELTRYLPDYWRPVIEKDVDGPESLPLRIDREVPSLGKSSACRRVARTVYLGSAPMTAAATRGLEDRRVKLGCVMPGETSAVFGDALRRLAAEATYLYQDGPRYWYSTQPTVTKLADDRAEQLKRDPDKVAEELERRLKIDLRRMGDFRRIHTLPQSSSDVPDDRDARLVILDAAHPYSREAGNAAEVKANEILEWRGSAPRLYRNTLLFLAADKTRLPELEEAIRRYLAWKAIVEESPHLDLTAQQVRQAEAQKTSIDSAVTARLPETYQWLLVPGQKKDQPVITWQALRLTGQDALAERASRKLRSDESLVASLGPTRLRHELDNVPLWDGNHVAIRQLVNYFARYPYLPRLTEPSVLLRTIGEGVGLMLWRQDSFAYADSFDETERRYRGLRDREHLSLSDPDSPALLVKPDVAGRQLDAETPPAHTSGAIAGAEFSVVEGSEVRSGFSPDGIAPVLTSTQPKRFYGSVTLNTTRVGLEASNIAAEVIAHLAGLIGANVTVTLDISAEIPSGTPDHVVRVVTENARQLGFSSQGFEKE